MSKMRSNSSNSSDRFIERRSLHSISDDTFVVLEGGSEISGSFSPTFSPPDYKILSALSENSREHKANSRSRDLDDGSYLKKKISFFEKSADDDRKRIETNNIESNTSSSLTKIKEKLSFVSKSKSVHLRETFTPDLLYYIDALHTHSPEEHNHNGGVTYCEAFLQAENISGLTSELLNPVAQLDYVESLTCSSLDFRSAQNSPDRLLKSMVFVNLSPPDYLCSEQPIDGRRTSNGIAADLILEGNCEAKEVVNDPIIKSSESCEEADLSNYDAMDNTGSKQPLLSTSTVNDHHLESLPQVSYQLLEWQSSDDNRRPTMVSANSVQDLVTVSASPTSDSCSAQDESAMESLYFEPSASADAPVDDCSSQYTACTMSSVTTSSAEGVWKHVDENNLALSSLSGAGGAIAIVEDTPKQLMTETSSRSFQVTEDNAVGVGSDPVEADSKLSGQSKQPALSVVQPQVGKANSRTLRKPDGKTSSNTSFIRDEDVVSATPNSTSGSRMGKYLRNMSPLHLSKQLLPSKGAHKTRQAGSPIEKVASSELQIANIYSNNLDQEVPDVLTSQANPMSTSKNDRSTGHPSSKKFRGLLGDWTYRSIYKSITSPFDYFDRQKVVAKKVPDAAVSCSTAHPSSGNSNYNAKWTSEALTGFDKMLVKRAQAKKLNLAAREDLKILKLTIERWILYEYLLDKVDKDAPLTPDESIEYDLITEEFLQQERVKAFITNEKNSKTYSLAERAELSALRLELDREVRFDGIYRKERHNEPFTFEEKAEYMLLRETLQREQMINQLVDKYKALLHAHASSPSGEELDISLHPSDTVDLIVMRIEQDKHKRYEQLVAKEKENKRKIATTCKLSSSSGTNSNSNSKLSLAEKSELVILRKELERQRRQQAEKVARLSQELHNGSNFTSPPHTPLSPCRSSHSSHKDAQYMEGGNSSVVKKNQRQWNTTPFEKFQSTSTSDSSPSSSDGKGGITTSKSSAYSASTGALMTLSSMGRHAATRTVPSTTANRAVTASSPSSASPHWSSSKSPYRGPMSSLNSPQSIRQAFPVQRLSSIQSSRKNMSEMVLSEFISPLLLYGLAPTASLYSSEMAMSEESCSGVTSLDASATAPFCSYEERTDTHRTEPGNDDVNDDDDNEHPLGSRLSAPTRQQQQQHSLVISSSPFAHAILRAHPGAASIASSPSLPPQQQQRQRPPSAKPSMRPPLPKAQTPSTPKPQTSPFLSPSPVPPRLTFSKMVELSMQQLKSEKERDLSREKQRRLSAFLRNNIDHRSTVADSVAQTMMTRRLSLRSHSESEYDNQNQNQSENQIGAT